MTRRAIFLGLAAIGGSVALSAAPASAQSANGKQLFTQRCSVCHANAPGAASTMGPNLAGVAGRKAGTAKYAYSPAMKAAKVTWNKDTLDKYLAGPTKMIPGVRMAVAVPDAAQRAAIVNYLVTGK